jgi:hypothetical protein
MAKHLHLLRVMGKAQARNNHHTTQPKIIPKTEPMVYSADQHNQKSCEAEEGNKKTYKHQEIAKYLHPLTIRV